MPTYHSPHHYLRATSSSGTSLDGIPWNTINLTDGSWTLVDPDNLVQSVSYSNGFNTVTWNAANPTASNTIGRHYNWVNSYEKKAPRWYKNLTIEGTQITARDYVLFNTFMENDDSVNDFNQVFCLGTGINPANNGVGDIDISGGICNKATNGTAAYGVLQWTGSTASNSGAPDSGVTTSFHGGRARGSGVYHTHKTGVSPFETQAAGSRNTNQLNRTATDTLKIVVGVGIRSNGDVVDPGSEQRFKLSYNSIKLTL